MKFASKFLAAALAFLLFSVQVHAGTQVIGSITTPTSTTVGDLTTWGDTTGTTLADGGSAATVLNAACGIAPSVCGAMFGGVYQASWFGTTGAALQSCFNYAGAGGTCQLANGVTYSMTAGPLSLPAASVMDCPTTGSTVTQGNGANLAEIVLTNGPALIKGACVIDGNRANNNLFTGNALVWIGTSNNVYIAPGVILQNGPDLGVYITTGLNWHIHPTLISNVAYSSIYATPRNGQTSNGDASDFLCLQVGAHCMNIDGTSGNRIHDITIQGTLIKGLTVNVTSTTVTVTAGGTPFSNTCSYTTLCPGQFIIAGGGGVYQEAFIQSIVSSTVANVSGATAVTGASAIGGSGDLIDTAALSSSNLFYNISLGGTAGGGIVDADFGDSANYGSHTFNRYSNIYMNVVGGNCFNIEQGNAADSIAWIYVSNINANDCLNGGAAIYAIAASPQGAFWVGGANLSRIFFTDNAVYDTTGSPPSTYWLASSTSPGQGAIMVRGNTSQGFGNPGIGNPFISVGPSANWGSTASVTAGYSNGDDFTVTVVPNGTGITSPAAVTVTKRVTGPNDSPLPQCKAVNSSAVIPASVYAENNSTKGQTIFFYSGTPAAGNTYVFSCRE